MKKILFLISIITLLFSSCASYPTSRQSGKDDTAYLLFVSPKTYSGEYVDVYIDNDIHFQAKVVKEKKAKRKGNLYSINTGKRNIKVKYNGTVLYEKNIFVSTQETKIITLP